MAGDGRTCSDWRSEPILPGDLVLVASSSSPGQIGHVGVAVTSTVWIEAVGTGDTVGVRSIPAADKIHAVRRVL